MSKLPAQNNENIIIGFENSDDAGVFRLNDDITLVQTVDFFTPITDDPEIFGEIAAINSLNDIYAMGGEPLTALSIVCYPQKGDWDVLGKILLGGQRALNNENVVVLGGHSVDDKEIKFGYAITGTIDSKRVISNSTAKEGDLLILTKPIGTGIISTGIKFQKAGKKAVDAALKNMTKSAGAASKAMREVGANSCTDITGFGLLGHSFEMAKASKVTFEIYSEKVPLLPDVIDLVEQKMLTRGDRNNRDYVGETIKFDNKVTKQMQSVLYDPQTAGGLLISLEKDKAEKFIKEIKDSKIIGKVKKFEDYLIEVN
ncbi:MAG: selenide, water dikinase SelD [Acidobacteriota bacterium]|nr:selenide, water dikinase SelD [Acidobacteriota bacterium]